MFRVRGRSSDFLRGAARYRFAAPCQPASDGSIWIFSQVMSVDFPTTLFFYGSVGAGDWIALSMLVIMAAALGMVAWMFYGMNRSAKRPMSPEEELMEELEEDQGYDEKASAGKGGGEVDREEWEKDPEWWKRSS